LHNIADDPAYADKLTELRGVLNNWIDEVGDLAAMPEKEMLAKWWNGADTPPATAKPVLTKVEGGYQLTCDTEGASIGYKVLNVGEEMQKIKTKQFSFCMMWTFALLPNGRDMEIDTPWNVYQEGETLALQPGQKLVVNAKRIGYTAAEETFEIQ